jgi:hypothetical protein
MMTSIVCGQCGTSATGRSGRPWCQACGIWLTVCELTGDWVSYAEAEARKTRARHARIIETTREAAHAAVDPARRLIPDGWQAKAGQVMEGACHTLEVYPPAGPVDVHAYLTPPHCGGGWYVRVSNRTQGVDFPLYTCGGAHAASFDSLAEAVTAAVTAVRTQLPDPGRAAYPTASAPMRVTAPTHRPAAFPDTSCCTCGPPRSPCAPRSATPTKPLT